MSDLSNHHMVSIYKTEVIAAVTLATMSFGAFSKAEKERALAERLGESHPAYEQVVSRVSLPEGLGKTLAGCAAAAGLMGLSGLLLARKSR